MVSNENNFPTFETPYTRRIGRLLRGRQMSSGPVVLDLFSGAGGLALGFEAQGFETIGFESQADCRATYRRNLNAECNEAVLEPGSPLPGAPVIVAGPPCQPFSVGGKQLGLRDSRDGFPVFIAAVQEHQPEIFIIENVRGLFYRSRLYLNEILGALRRAGYIVEAKMLNARYHGVPQNRERVFIVGHRGRFEWPKREDRVPTAGDALGEMATYIPDEAKFLTPSMDAYVARYEKASHCVNPRDLNLNRAARTLTCRNLAGATGDMHRVKLPDGRRRRLLAREAARLQSFPDWFRFEGGEISVFNQIGNAVPPVLAYQLAGAVRRYLESNERRSGDEIAALNGAHEVFQPALL